MYDILAGKENMESSYLMSKGLALETFPMLKSDGLFGAVVYYDGQHNDSRMNRGMTKRVRVRLSHSHCHQIDSATQRHQCD
jgi:glycerol-3-phosphate dehydrogenase